MLKAAIVSEEPKASASLRITLEQTGLIQSVVEWTTSAEQYPNSADAVPAVVFIDLTRARDEAFAFAAHLRRINPSTCIVACSPLENPGPEMLLQAMHSGVQDILPQPVNSSVLRTLLTRLATERGAAARASFERLIVFMGAKGGVGTTTLAVNLGVQLANLTQRRVVLLDFAQPLGQSTLLLDLQHRFDLRDAVENLERLDSHLFNGFLVRHNCGLEVLAGVGDPEEWLRIPVPELERVVNVAQSSSGIALADLGSSCSSDWAPILRQARAIVLVAHADVPSLWALERRLTMLTSLGLARDRLRIVINRWHRADDEALKTFEQKTKFPIYARLPNDFRQVSEAVNRGVPLSRNHNDPLGTNLKDLASRLAGVRPVSNDHHGSLLGLFLSPRRS